MPIGAPDNSVRIKAQYSDSVDLYAHINNVTPSMTVDANIDDTAAVLTINLASPLDFAFTIAAEIHIGDWDLSVNGSVTSKIAHVIAPPLAKIDIYQINVSMTDNVVMDSAKFGGISALTNGILFRLVNSTIKNLPLVVNNIGFAEQGFDITYDPKAPAGIYGFQAKKNYKIINGVSLRINGDAGDELQCIIRDDLTDLTMFNITVNGHVVQH